MSEERTNCLEPSGSKKRAPKGVVGSKVGTVPMCIIMDRRCSFEVGKIVRFKRITDWNCKPRFLPWDRGEITNLDPLKISLF